MTATLKNLAKLKKAERAKSTKIEHPLARYNNIGQLMCIVCKVNVKTDALWNNHMALPSHRENLLALQKQKSEDNTNTQKRKRVEEEQEQIKKAKMELEVRQQKDFFSENTFKVAPIVPQQVEPKVVSQHIPDGFFDDSKQQAHAHLVSNARQVQIGGTYTNQEEIDEEQQLINAMKMKRQQQAKQKKSSNFDDDDIEIDLDEIVGVEDFSSLTCDSSNKIKIILEPIKADQKNDMEEEYGTEMQYPLLQHVDDVVDDTAETHQKIENSIIEDALARRDGFEKMKNLKQKHEETKSKNNIEQGMAERKKERKKKKKMEEDDIEIEGDNIMELDFWRSQGI